MDTLPSLKQFSMDITEVPLTERGVPDLIWPLSWIEFGQIRDRFLMGASTIIQTAYKSRQGDAELLTICSSIYIAEALSGLFVCAAHQRYRELSYDVRFSSCKFDHEGNISGWLKRPRELEHFARQLKKNLLRDRARALFGLVKPGPFHWRNPTKKELGDSAIVVNASQLARYHALSESRKPVYVNQRYWFGGADKHMSRDWMSLSVSADLRASLGQELKKSARSNGIDIPDVVLEYLDSYLANSTGFSRSLLNYVKSRPEKLPMRLWTGTGGKLSHRILHNAVRDNGGRSWSHDHGSGSGYFDINTSNITEFASPDVMATFSEPMAAGYRNNIDGKMAMGQRTPEIVGVTAPLPATTSITQKPRSPAKSSGRKVLLISNQYRAEIGRFTPIEADVVLMDWQTRLFSWLKKNGDIPLFKAHPDSKAFPAGRFEELLGVQTITTPFERLEAEDYDIILLDYVGSSMLYSAMMSGKPVVFPNFDHSPFQPAAGELFQRRVRVVEGWHNSDNRCEVDWADMARALDEAYDLVDDTSFIDTYLPFGRG